MTRTTTEDGSIGRVYGTSAIVWAVGSAIAWEFWGPAAALGWTAGAAMSIGVLRGFEWIVKRSFVPGAGGAAKDFTRFSVIKLPIILLVVAVVVLVGGRSLPAMAGFCAGVLLTQSVIVLKTVGAMITGRQQL